jgi:hypothetical protein
MGAEVDCEFIVVSQILKIQSVALKFEQSFGRAILKMGR